jgi:hypothetical protein
MGLILIGWDGARIGAAAGPERPRPDRKRTKTRFLDRQQALIDGAVARNVPVVQIFHVEDEGPFSPAWGSSLSGGTAPG